MSNSLPIHLIHFSGDLRHLLLDTIPTLLRCNDSFVNPSRRMHPTQKFVRRHQHDLTSAQVRTPADLVSHHSQDTPEQELGRKTRLRSELLAQIAVFLNLSGCSSPAASDPHLPTWMSLILSSSCWVFSGVTARCVRMSNRHLLSSSIPGFHRHIPCTSLCSSSFPLFDSLCVSDCVSVRTHPCFSRQGSLNDRSDSFSAFVVLWLRRFSMRCKRCASWAASSVPVSFNVKRQDVESSGYQLLVLFQPQSLAMRSRSFCVRCDFLRQLQFWSHHLPRSATQTFPVRRFPRSARALFLSLTRSVSAIVSLYAFILAFPVKVLSMIVETNKK